MIGLKPPGKIGSQPPAKASTERNAGGKPDKATDILGVKAEDKLGASMVLDPLGIAGMPMTLVSQQEPLGDMDPSAAEDTSETEGEKSGPSQVCGTGRCV